VLSREKRTRVTAVVLVAALVGGTLLGALGAVGAFTGDPSVRIPAQGPWAVLVAGDLSSADCDDDPAVAQSYLSEDVPSTSGGLLLATDARVADVERVVACVTRVVDPARVSVVQVEPAADQPA